MIATLLIPFKGYTRIELIEKCGIQWKARVIGSGLDLCLFEDEFIID